MFILHFLKMKNKTAIFPGTFDPLTFGHIEIINNSLKVFEKIIIAIGNNSTKKQMFDIETRKKFIQVVYQEKLENILIHEYDGLTIEFCKKMNIHHIIRGVRNTRDFEYENDIFHANQNLNKQIQTLFFPTSTKTNFISSSIVRDIILHNGDLKNFLPEDIINMIQEN